MDKFEGLWAKASAKMDEVSDRIVGDKVEYSRLGGPYQVIDAYVLISHARLEDLGEYDEAVDVTKRLKVRCTIFPKPDPADRVRHPLLGDREMRPMTSLPDEQGRYWIADLQKV